MLSMPAPRRVTYHTHAAEALQAMERAAAALAQVVLVGVAVHQVEEPVDFVEHLQLFLVVAAWLAAPRLLGAAG